MPLPAALAAKLSKRGLITPKAKREQHPKKQDFKGLSTCPNKSNIFHDCTHWCETHWKSVNTPDPKYARNMQKLLMKYPLPNYWTEIFDKGLGRYYYWNMENDLVSWLPPKHPKAVPTKCAAKLREKRLLIQRLEREEAENKEKDSKISDKDRDRESDSDEEKSQRPKYSDKRAERDRERDDRRSRRDERYRNKKPRPDILDPMDPAAYSDIPQGTWSDGLESNRGRADNTATGVLYQQRPYPAPGEVLAANREKSKKK